MKRSKDLIQRFRDRERYLEGVDPDTYNWVMTMVASEFFMIGLLIGAFVR